MAATLHLSPAPPSSMLELTVPPAASGNRLDRFLADSLAHLSRSRVQALIRDGHVQLNRRPAKPSEALRPADVVSWEEPAVVETELKAESIELAVLCEDDDLIVINKAAGLVTHPAPGNEAGTLVNALLAHCPTLSGIGGERRPGIVHRLDKDTTGCLVIAKNDFTHRALAEQFAARTVLKNYLALVAGALREPAGTLDAPIGRHPTNRKRMAVLTGRHHARPARTDYRVVQTFQVDATNTLPAMLPLDRTRSHWTISLVECRLHSGRTHQIRVHLKHLGHPILGDALYGGLRPPERQMLHAWKLGFAHPRTGLAQEFRAPLPDDFLAFGLKEPETP